MKTKITIPVLFLLCMTSLSFSQVKVVIMGSSTAYGVGASTYENSWAGKITSFYNQNILDGQDTVFYNIAYPAYDTYQEMPDGFVPPPGRPFPDMDYNVTKALSYNPAVVIISLPSNDINYGYSKHEMISNLRLMSETIISNGTTRCFVTTPQPRNDLDQGHRDSLVALIDSVNLSFGPYAINFWDGLATTDGLNSLKEEYRFPTSPIHLNDLGHDLLFNRVKNTQIFGIGGPLALQLTLFNAQLKNSSVLFNWRTERQGPNTNFELQRSSDGYIFETIFTQNIVEARPTSDYSTMDRTPLAGKSFYRLRITENGRQTYSNTINIMSPGKMLIISKLFINNGSSGLTAEINIQKSQFVNLVILNSAGAILVKKKEFISEPVQLVNIPVGNLAAGQYFLRIITDDGNTAVKSFTK